MGLHIDFYIGPKREFGSSNEESSGRGTDSPLYPLIVSLQVELYHTLGCFLVKGGWGGGVI